MSHYLYLKLLLRNNLLLDLDEYALEEHGRSGLVCGFMGLRLTSTFQPLFRADGKLVGREALLRPGYLEHGEVAPEAAFDDALKAKRLVQFDRLVRVIHLLNHARSFPSDEILFLNVHPELVASVGDHGRTFEQILHYYSVPTSQVAIEIREAGADDAHLARAAENYRSLGYRIALDGLAATPESIVRALDLCPNFVKLDAVVLDRVDEPDRLVARFRERGIQVVIQRIETAEQLQAARCAGADLLQGHQLARPEYAAAMPSQLRRGEQLAA